MDPAFVWLLNLSPAGTAALALYRLGYLIEFRSLG